MSFLHILKCPNCGALLVKKEHTYDCPWGHRFDIAKEGYVNLLVHTQKKTGDEDKMVIARHDFFKGDHYHVLKDEIIKIVQKIKPAIIVDAGAGEGYYTRAIAQVYEAEIYAFDMSKKAIKLAKKACPDLDYIVANVFHMPLIDESADLVLSIFTPLGIKEDHRILKDGGYLLKVGPGPKHLYEMKEVVYDEPYLNPSKELAHPGFKKLFDYEIKDVITLKHDDIKALFEMTPYIHSCPIDGKERLFALKQLVVSIAFRLELFQKSSS